MHHITHIDNFLNIINCGYLYSRNYLINNKCFFEDTANYDIINKRGNNLSIDLNEYIPFHIDYYQKEHEISYNHEVIMRKKPENMIFFIFSQFICEAKNCLFYMYHPVSIYGRYFTSLNEYAQNMRKEYKALKKGIRLDGKPYLDYSDHKVQEFLCSEILIKDCISLNDASYILVYNEDIQDRLRNMLPGGTENELYNKIIVNKEFYRI